MLYLSAGDVDRETEDRGHRGPARGSMRVCTCKHINAAAHAQACCCSSALSHATGLSYCPPALFILAPLLTASHGMYTCEDRMQVSAPGSLLTATMVNAADTALHVSSPDAHAAEIAQSRQWGASASASEVRV